MIAVGKPAPGFRCRATLTPEVSLEDYANRSWVALFFYEQDWTPI